MLAIQADCHAGHIKKLTVGIPMNAEAVSIFLSTDECQLNINLEQKFALAMQSQSNFSQMELLNPAEDCWNSY